ncbi:hypothetical protein Y032_0238g3290 [Ancylostoma ceylanicum]|uniref:Uncharacterized protein n=1 Tax=Ancylostoma ceylanicum TaxID=53326 RepID=A0A016SF40_9BILA|nr:hypothetical protein Y032_0238g3290 [Ancylostoma ceylanicum]
MTSSTSLQMNHVASWIIDDNKHNQLVSSLFDRRSSHTQQDFANDRNESQPTLSAIKEEFVRQLTYSIGD